MGIHPVSLALCCRAAFANMEDARFNGGPRACLGQQMALTQASYTIVRLLQEFETIACRDPEPEWIESIALVTKSRNGAMVALKRAQKLE